MEKKNYGKEVVVALQEVSTIRDILTKKETENLVKEALQESKNYIDVKIRQSERIARREEKMLKEVQRKSVLAIILFICSLILLLISENSIKINGSNIAYLPLIFGSILLIISCYFIGAVSVDYQKYYKTKYTIIYSLNFDLNESIHVYTTYSKNIESAISRFYKVYGLEKYIHYVKDEFGNKYNSNGDELKEV